MTGKHESEVALPILCQTSHPSVVSNRAGSVASDSAASYITLPCGLRIKSSFEHLFKTCKSSKDFESVLLHACFDNPEEMRMRKGDNNSAKFSDDWLAKAGAYYAEWLKDRPEISPAEGIKLIKGLGANLSKSNRNKKCRGVNLAMRTAREEGRCPKEAKEVYIAEQSAREAAGTKRKAGGGRPKSAKRSSASASSSSAPDPVDYDTVQASTSTPLVLGEVSLDQLGPGPVGPHAIHATHTTVWQSYSGGDESDKENR